MRDEVSKYKTFGRRAIFIGGIKLALLSLIAGRYFFLQISRSEKYKTLSENNRIKIIIVPPLRGSILDRNDEKIADNTIFYRLGVDSEYIKELEDIVPKVEDILGRKLKLSLEQIKKRLIKRNRNEPLIIEDSLTWHEVSKASLNNHLLEGVEVIQAPVRSYLQDESFVHITGYIGCPTEKEIDAMDLISFNELKIGKSGIEKIYDETLRGYPGLKRTEVDVKGTLIRELSKDSPTPGDNLKLTIDANLQKHLFDVMAKDNINGAVVVLKAKTGEVLAMHSSPSFNPNEFVDGVSQKYWDQLMAHPHNPMINNVVSTPYPPGSTFKIITAIAALRHGYSPNRTHTCTGVHYVGSRPFKCWKSGGHGTLDLTQAIAQSCNPYFYSIAQNIGVDIIADTARKLGYGSLSKIELPFEHAGLIPDPKWKQNRYKMTWYMGDTINTAIGQGYVLVTPIQLATMTARVATGTLVTPTLIYKEKYEPFAELDIPKKCLTPVQEGMRKAANVPLGTVYRHEMSRDDFVVCGKTGTAQVASLKFHSAGKKFEHHGLFTSFAPFADPQYVISVVVEHGKAGAATAAPVAKQIYNELFEKYYNVTPPQA
jgi:penicillin-binding protein 2